MSPPADVAPVQVACAESSSASVVAILTVSHVFELDVQNCPTLHVALPHVHSTLVDTVFEHAPPVPELRLADACDKCREENQSLGIHNFASQNTAQHSEPLAVFRVSSTLVVR